ncbi:MAG: AraC family transcriptional regulator [Defluviitaleaceae bacterium]|nr:AraC family transcriptional regulator [Defluviitaleaceae bacterium]
MHAWESIQKTLNWIEGNIGEEIQIDKLAEVAALSLFYYQRLFARLVKKPVKEYIKLRRLAHASKDLQREGGLITDISIKYGFANRETFSRAFKETYGFPPSKYRDSRIDVSHFDKPDLLLNYITIDEGVPLISDGIVLEMNRKFSENTLSFLGVARYMYFERGKMFGERPGVSAPSKIWDELFQNINKVSRSLNSRLIGVCYKGDAPEGYTTYFAGVEVEQSVKSPDFTKWQLPAREYAVCGFEAESFDELVGPALGKAMKYTRFWLKKRGWIADGFFVEMYYQQSSKTPYMELWIPFKKRENIN